MEHARRPSLWQPGDSREAVHSQDGVPQAAGWRARGRVVGAGALPAKGQAQVYSIGPLLLCRS